MKNFIKTFLFTAIFALTLTSVSAKNIFPAIQINSAIKKADISKNAVISVSIRDTKTGKQVYSLNADKPMNPASTQKLVTIIPSMATLGENYEFKTALYVNKSNGDLYLKTGADPYLTTEDVKGLIKKLANYKIYKTKAFYTVDSIIDSNEWGEGWQWDDDMNPLMPKFSAYNIDKNLMGITVSPTVQGAPAEIETDVFYPTVFMNNVITGDKNDVKLDRKNYISPDVISATGTVKTEETIQVPVNFPRRYFVLRLKEILRAQKFDYYGEFSRSKLPKGAKLLAEVNHPIVDAENDILKNSNNMIAETVFKVAGGKYAKAEGSSLNSTDMLIDYYTKQGIKTDNIRIVDGSGVSKNNLITANFMTDALAKEALAPNFSSFESHMASPGEGTLRDRMLYFKGNLKAKTGTLSNISAIAGYLTTKGGKKYSFCIMISDPKSKSADKKAFEEYVLRNAYEAL
jgi:D-alanyl-D-alanine carboxypeptidase/D-alanyl-D-alanine-endopeptidase (penicillin-binding protein 4)